MKNKCPCEKCTKRYLYCHAKCSEYINWKKLDKAIKQELRKAAADAKAAEKYSS